MNYAEIPPLIWLALNGVALGLGIVILAWLLALNRRARRLEQTTGQLIRPVFFQTAFPQRPANWLAIRSVSPEAVKAALGLSRFAPCSWSEGMTGSHEFFISPRVNGWVIVTGLGLPNPTDDVDACFLFLTALSRKLGHVQFFYADRVLHHHGWARMDEGCVTRAYSWTGETSWSQGVETLPEIELGVRCFRYGEISATPADAENNFEKVPSLAARWSLVPAEIKAHFVKHANGIAGESARIY
jgi:hypothetical protein